MFQRVQLIGNLGRDPEMRYTAAGKAVTNFSMATTERWPGADGQPNERVTWWRVAAWGPSAEACNKYLSKGRQVYVEGSLSEPKPYQGKDGEWRASLDVRASLVKFLGGGRGAARDEGETPGETPGETEERKPWGNAAPPDYQGEEEIPF